MKYQCDSPYPSIQDLDINLKYGYMMLSNLGGLHSEMNAVSLYHYNHVIINEEWNELADVFMHIAMVEMEHLDIFSKMCLKLGVDPRLWECQDDFLEYWSPGYNVYPKQIYTMLKNAIFQEQNTIDIYRYQIECIDEPIIQNMLKRIIEDEKLHIKILQYFLKLYCEKNDKTEM